MEQFLFEIAILPIRTRSTRQRDNLPHELGNPSCHVFPDVRLASVPQAAANADFVTK
jgi:hypothetical protein